MDNNQKLIRIFSSITGSPAGAFSDESSPDTIKGWTSVTHVQLVLGIEEEFEVSLTPEDAAEMLSLHLVKLILGEKGVTFGPAEGT